MTTGLIHSVSVMVARWKCQTPRKKTILRTMKFSSLLRVPDLTFNRNPALTRNENGAFSAAGEHLSKYIQFGSPSRRTPAHTFLGNINHPNFPYDYVHDVLGKSAPSPDNDDGEEDLSRPETPPARQPSLPPDHEDANGLEYAEDEIEMRSDFPAPPGHAALASDDSTFDCSGVDLRIASDTEILFPRSDEELARISKEFKREVMDSTVALAMQPPVNILRPRHPLAQSNVLPSPDPVPGPELQHLVIPHPVPRTPSPSRTIPGGKRKRVSTPEDEQEGHDTGNIAGPSTIAAHPNGYVPRQVVTRNNEDRVSPKRRRLITRQQTWDLQMVAEAGYVPAHLDVDPPTRESPPESSQPAHRQTSPPPIATSQILKEDSELEKSQVIEMLSQNVEQGESEDEESTRNILRGLGGSQRILPALTPDNTQPASADDSQSETETPAESQIPARVPSPIPEDVFGPIVLSAKANKISDRFPAKVSKNTDGDIIMSDPEHETANTSSKSTRFNFDESEKEGKVFRKTPFRPRTSSRVMEIRNLLVAEVEAENKDTLKPLPSPKKKKRAVGLRARKPSPTPSIEAEPTIGPEGGLPSVSASKPPSRLRRGRSASVQPEVPALPKTPVKRSTRGRK